MMSLKFIANFVFISFLFSWNFIAAQGLNSTHHDFGGAAWSSNQKCLPCHTPHNANMQIADSPLWNHQVTIATYTLYANSTMNSSPGQPSGNSKLCLSCHDGTVAVDNYSGITSGIKFAGFGDLTTDLSHNHPISFAYDPSLAATDGHLNNPATGLSGLGGTITTDLLENGNMECTSCHDVHISRNVTGCTGCHILHPPGGGGMQTITLSLWKSNTNSALCLTCHKK